MKKILLTIFIFIFLGINQAQSANNSDSWTWVTENPEVVEIMFFELNSDWSTWEKIDTETTDWVTREDNFNDFIKKSVKVLLYYKKWSVEKTFQKIFEQNTDAIVNLNAKINESKTITRKIEVIRINKVAPSWTIKYSPSNDEWTNTAKNATLEWSAAWDDWLVWNHKPSYTCDQEGWCTGTLTIQDSAWNSLTKTYNIQKIDKSAPTIHTKKYAQISWGKQKIWYRCEDAWGSWCKNWTSEIIDYLPSGSSKVYCVYDNAWNSSCQKVTAANSARDYSDDHLSHTNSKRKLYLKCIDDFSWCTTPQKTEYRYKNVANTTLTIKDNAGNSYTKVFQISKIDKVKPTVNISSPDNFKASDYSRISVSFNDNVPSYLIDDYSQSWISNAKYRWNSSCKSWNNIVGTTVSNGENINYTVAWNHTLYLCAKDNAGNIWETSKNITIYPWDIDLSNSSIETNSINDKFANNNDFYIYSIVLKDKYDNPIYWKQATNINQKCDNSSCKTIYLDMVDDTYKDDAIIEYDFSWASNTDWKINFKLKSYTPGEFSHSFYFKLRNWDDDYNNIGSAKEYYVQWWENSFLKPIEWKIEILEWWEYPEIWKEQKYKINLINTWSLANYNYWELKIEKSSIKQQVDGHFWNEFKDEQWYFGNNIRSDNVWFVWKIDANKNILQWPQIKAYNLELKYNIFGKNIRYFLDNIESEKSCDLETLGAKIFGQLQWDGKSDITWQEENFSDLSLGETRAQIRKNAYSQIATMTPNTEANGIKYVEWQNYVVETNPNYETLVVKNWNVIFNKTKINEDNSKLWIIVLKDNYKVGSDYNNKWNIYVANNVEYIWASIYADGALRSAKYNGSSYNDLELNTKLKMYGSLFTRNTIWGAVLWWEQYTIPGWQITSNFDLAEKYDLNYVRKIDKVCSGNPEDNYSFVIEYNPSIQTNPPKLFSK